MGNETMAKRDAIFLSAGGVLRDQPPFGGDPLRWLSVRLKASTLKSDRGRIETHIKPLLGARLVSRLTLQGIEGMQADIAAGMSARGRKKGRGGQSTGGPGVASRAISTL